MLDAVTENDLVVRLSNQGLRLKSIAAAPGAQPGPSVSTSRVVPVSGLVAANNSVPAAAPKTAPAVPTVSQSIRTKRASAKDLMFLFTQLGTLLRSGISPTAALTELASRLAKSSLSNVLHEMSKRVATGATLADSMAVYADVFPPGTVKSVQAGETGGYTWQACETLSEQFASAHKMRWAVRLFRWVAVAGLLGVPVVFAITLALDYSFATLSGLPGLVKGFGQAMLGPAGLAILVMTAGYWVLRLCFVRTEARALRHKIGAHVPVFSAKARAECLAVFNWHLGKLSEAGIAPMTAWRLAGESVPNEHFAGLFRELGQRATESTKLSQLVRSSKVFPPEYCSVIETGELAGSLPAALSQASVLANDSASRYDKASRTSLYLAYIALFMVLGIICGKMFYTAYVNSLIKHTVEEAEQ